MHKLVIDTNILVSALISTSYPAQIIQNVVLPRKAIPVLTDAIWSEYVNVLNRDKFARFPNFRANADIVLLRFNELAEWVNPIEELSIINDVDDNRFLEAAQASSADYLITGNSNDFTISMFGVTRIVTPNAYWEDYRHIDY